MLCVKSLILCVLFLTLWNVEAFIVDKDETQEMLTVSNDVEVYKPLLESQKEKQEEEEAVEPVAEAEGDYNKLPEAGEQKEPENETAPDEEGETALKEEVKDNPESEVEPAPEIETKIAAEPAEDPPDVEKEPEPELQPESEPEPEPEPEKESDDVPTKGTDDSEMPNDAAAKEETKDIASVTKDVDGKKFSCFACTDSEDTICSIKPTKQVPCPKTNEGDKGKHNGCYTLYEVDTNTTMRGCVDQLTEERLKHCLTHEKFCDLCYSNNCNSKVAPSNAAKLQFNIHSLTFFTTSIIITKFTSFFFI